MKINLPEQVWSGSIPFMKALGRPTRENVATSRDEQATLLQALELTNGDYFNDVLEEGAAMWLKEFDNSETIAEDPLPKIIWSKPNKG